MYGEISFPGLGISVNPSRVAFMIGPKAIYWYGIIIAFGFLLAVFYGLRRASVFGLTQDNIIDMLICAVPMAIICARLYYCFFSWDLYKENPISILYIWEGGLAIYGGVIGAVLGLLIYSLVRKVPAAPLLDVGGLGLMIGQAIGRWGNFFNREAFGSVTDSFLRMGLMDANGVVTYHHPTFLYESLWNAIGFVILHFYSKHRKFDGQIFIAYLGWYGLGRMFIEGLRTDSLYVAGTNLRVSQLLAGLCLLAAILILGYHKIFREYDPDLLYVNRKDKTEGSADKEASAAVETNEEKLNAESEETDHASMDGIQTEETLNEMLTDDNSNHEAFETSEDIEKE